MTVPAVETGATLTAPLTAAPGTTPPATAEPQMHEAGFPLATPVDKMTPEQQAAYWRTESKKHQRVTDEELETLRNAATELESYKSLSQTDQERAVNEARKLAAKEAEQKLLPRLVAAEFRAAAAGRLDSDRLNGLIEPLDMSKFLTTKGEVDTDRVAAWVNNALATAGVAGGTKASFPDLGQGQRGSTSRISGAELGLAEAQRRFGTSAGASK